MVGKKAAKVYRSCKAQKELQVSSVRRGCTIFAKLKSIIFSKKDLGSGSSEMYSRMMYETKDWIEMKILLFMANLEH